jgi:catechol 2,3-dioxygenase-like lactoylglutathione lyase family enzyme
MSARIFRTAYTVSNMERSLEFYRDILGLSVVRDRERAGESYDKLLGLSGVRIRVVILQEGSAGGHLLELVEYLQPRSERRSSKHYDVGASNICYIVDDVDAMHSRIKAAGFNTPNAPADFMQEGKVTGRIVMVFDPDNIPVVLLQQAKS